MKKIFGLLFVLVGAFTLAACGEAASQGDVGDTGNVANNAGDAGDVANNADDTGDVANSEEVSQEKTAFELLSRVEAEMAEVDSMIMETEMEMSMEFLGQPMDVTSASRAYTMQIGPSEFEMRVETVTETMGMAVPSTMYFRDGMMYMDMEEMQTKFELPLEDALQLANVENFEFEFDEESIISQSVSTNGDERELQFVLDFTAMMDSLGGELGAMMEMFGDVEGIFDGLTVDMTIVIDSDYQMISMTMAYEMEFEGSAMDVKMTSTIVQMGGVEITFPDNLDEFEEIDSAMMGF